MALARSEHTFFLVALSLNSVFSFLSNLSMAKVLPLSAYGVYTSCAALFNFAIILVNAVQNTATLLVAHEAHDSGDGSVWRSLRFSLRELSLIGLALFGLSLLAAPPIGAFLNCEVWPVVCILLTVSVLMPFAVSSGGLQGLQRFRMLGIAVAASSLGRLLVGLILVWLGLGLTGAVLSMPLSLGIGVLFNLALLVMVYRRQRQAHQIVDRPVEPGRVRRVYLTTGTVSLAGTLAFALLTGLDVVTVQHFLAGEVAGHYAVASTLGRTVLYFCQPLGLILLPRVTQAFVAGDGLMTRQLLRRTLWGTVGLGVLGIVGLSVFGGVVASIFATGFPSDLVWLIPLHGGAMLLYSLIAVWVAFFIAVRGYVYLLLMLPALGLQMVLFWNWHASLWEVVGVLYLMAFGLYGLAEVCLWQMRPKLSLLRAES